MTNNQEITIFKLRRLISDIRTELDILMYRQDVPLSEKEYNKVREAYDSICKANDQLP